MKILTANRLVDGDVVFLTPENDWSIDINEALIVCEKTEAARLEKIGAKADAAAHVIGCYLVDVVVTDGKTQATHYREIMRANGPTVRGDLGKQAQVYGSGGLRSRTSTCAKIFSGNDHHFDLAAFSQLEQEKIHVSV